MNIIARTNTHNTTVAKGRKIAYIVIHFTAGVTSRSGSAANIASWFKDVSQKEGKIANKTRKG